MCYILILIFCRYPDDSSVLSKNCAQWKDAKWGANYINVQRMVDHPMYIDSQKHFILAQHDDRFDCDDFQAGVSIGDFWKIYVR